MNEPSQNLFIKNQQILAVKQPKLIARLSLKEPSLWQFCKTGKEGELNLQREVLDNTHFLHSSQNIALEARQWMGSHELQGIDWLLVYGIGLGYYYKELSAWLKEDNRHRVIFLEDDLEVLSKFLETEMATAILQDSQVELYFIDLSDPADTIIDELSRKFIYQSFLFRPLVSYEKEKEATFSRINFLINFKLFGLQNFFGEYLDRGRPFFKNFYNNLFQYPKALQGNSLYGRFKGIPAIICGAGPSLQKNIEILKTLKDKALIFAGGTAMNALNAYQLLPHFGLGVDPFPAQFTRLIMNIAFETPFFIRNRMNFEALQMIHGTKLYLAGATGYPIADWFDKELHLEHPNLDEGCNVINMSLTIAEALGCNPIICVGVDLAYSSGESYSPGIALHPIHDTKEHFITKSIYEELVLQKDIYGQPIYTLWKWIQEAAWFSNFANSHPETTLLNATEGGIGFSGVPNISLKEAASLCLNQQYDFDAILHGAFLNSPMPKEVNRNKLNQVVSQFAESLMRTSEILREIYAADPSNWNNRVNDPKAGTDHRLIALEEKLKSQLAYKELLAVFDEHYQKYMKSALENQQSSNQILDSLVGRFPYLLEITFDNLKYIDEAIQRENFLDVTAKPPLEKTSAPPVEFAEGELPGSKQEEFYENGKVKLKQYFKQGLLDGPSVLYSKEGTILASSHYVNGKKNGMMHTYYENGMLHSLQKFKEGVLDGKQEFYYADGSLKSVINYDNGLIDGDVLLYFSTGVLKRQLHFKLGKREGVDRIYNESGKIKIEAQFQDNLPTGVAKLWHDNGLMAKEVIFMAPGVIEKTHQWNETGVQLQDEAKPPDYFDEVTKETEHLSGAIEQIVHHVQGLAEAMGKDKLSIEIWDNLTDLKQQLSAFQEIGEKLQKESGIKEGGREPVWKTPGSKRLIQQYLELVTGPMQESMFKMMTEMKNLRDKYKEKPIKSNDDQQ